MIELKIRIENNLTVGGGVVNIQTEAVPGSIVS